MTRSPQLVALIPDDWDSAKEAKLREALKEYPIFIDWIADMQADTVASNVLNPVDFERPASSVAAEQAYSKGRLSVLLEQMGVVNILLKQPASD